MISRRRTLSQRANAARSRGPKTPEGKSRSALNATRHGLLARCVVLDNESRSAFEALLRQYHERFDPIDSFDFGMVEEMAASYWRLRRAWAIETHLMNQSIGNQPDGDEIPRIAAAFTQLAASPELGLLHRYETRLHRMFQRALHNFLLLRDATVPNEPNPISEHPAGECCDVPSLLNSPSEPQL